MTSDAYRIITGGTVSTRLLSRNLSEDLLLLVGEEEVAVLACTPIWTTTLELIVVAEFGGTALEQATIALRAFRDGVESVPILVAQDPWDKEVCSEIYVQLVKIFRNLVIRLDPLLQFWLKLTDSGVCEYNALAIVRAESHHKIVCDNDQKQQSLRPST